MSDSPVLVLRAVTGESFEAARDAARRRFNAFDADLREHRRRAAQRATWRDDYTNPACTDRYWENP